MCVYIDKRQSSYKTVNTMLFCHFIEEQCFARWEKPLHNLRLGIRPVDDISESVFAVGRVNGGTGFAGIEVGGIVEQVDINQVQTSVKHTDRIW